MVRRGAVTDGCRSCFGCYGIAPGLAMEGRDGAIIPVFRLFCVPRGETLAELLNPSGDTLRDATNRARDCREFRWAV